MKRNELVDFKLGDYVVIGLYLLLWGFISVCYSFSYLKMSTLNSLIQVVLFLFPVLLFISYYRRLRVLKVNLIWLMISLIQIVILFQFKNNNEFQNMRGSYLDSIYNLFFMLVMLFIFRKIYFYFFKQELIIITRYSNFGEREANYFDYFFTILGLITLLAICPIVFMKIDFF